MYRDVPCAVTSAGGVEPQKRPENKMQDDIALYYLCGKGLSYVLASQSIHKINLVNKVMLYF